MEGSLATAGPSASLGRRGPREERPASDKAACGVSGSSNKHRTRPPARQGIVATASSAPTWRSASPAPLGRNSRRQSRPPAPQRGRGRQVLESGALLAIALILPCVSGTYATNMSPSGRLPRLTSFQRIRSNAPRSRIPAPSSSRPRRLLAIRLRRCRLTQERPRIRTRCARIRIRAGRSASSDSA